MRLVGAYDTLRLSIYKQRGLRGDHIGVDRLGHSTLLRFEDVGYFNAVYSNGPDIFNHLLAIERHYHSSPHGCRLTSAVLHDTGPLADQCRLRGWTPAESYVWLSGSVPRRIARPLTSLTVRQPRKDEARVFFRIYLEAFDADPARFASAIENMRWLFDEPALHFRLAFDGYRPVGVGMLLHRGPDALLCAAAMVPSHRRLGGHEALLAARFGLARDLGCTTLHSWAHAGGPSHANMTRAGLKAVALTRCWRWRAGGHP